MISRYESKRIGGLSLDFNIAQRQDDTVVKPRGQFHEKTTPKQDNSWTAIWLKGELQEMRIRQLQDDSQTAL